MRGWLRCFNAWDLMASFVIHISDSKLHDVNVLDMLLPMVGAFLCFRALSNTRYQLVSQARWADRAARYAIRP
jgi:hypothetical protein